MIKRPKCTDTVDDIMEMQKEFMAEKAKDVNFQPSAKIVKAPNTSIFAKSRADAQKPPPEDVPMESPSGSDAKPSAVGSLLIIGNIVERESRSPNADRLSTDVAMSDATEAFPKVERLVDKVKTDQTQSTRSLFAQSKMKKSTNPVAVEAAAGSEFGESSCIIRNDKRQDIHSENVEFLKQHSEEDILMEQQRLLGMMDPSIVKFLQQRRKAKLDQISEASAPIPPKATAGSTNPIAEVQLPDIDILRNDNLKKWLHFDIVETAKMEWMRDLPANMPELKPGETYEARFDWKGVLLPFTLKSEENSSTDLFLHGDDAHRPGYTLQELFRLARSTVMQQRTSAIGAIGGILSISTQGYYDNILELPISKMFFLLRYAFDDNSAAMIEVTSKALSALFYNETDEILLDLTFDCSSDFVEPTMEVPDAQIEDDDEDLDDKFANMNINRNVFQAKVSDDENNISSMNDFHLAETDLVKCVLRTNILQRISYIFSSLNLESSTSLNCIKILIRVARYNRSTAENILSYDELIKQLFKLFSYVPQSAETHIIRLHNITKVYVLKLWRVIMGYDIKFINRLTNYGLKDLLKNCIFLQENNVTVEMVKLQTEANRCAKMLICTAKCDQFYDDLLPAFHYTLEWIYQFVIFENPEHFIFRQCASAIISLISAKTASGNIFPKLPLCFSKWFSGAAKYPVEELSQIILLSTCVNAIGGSTDVYGEFLDTYFRQFLGSQTYLKMAEVLLTTSPLLSKNRLRENKHEAFPDLNSVIYSDKNLPTFIISEKYPVFFFQSLIKLVTRKSLQNQQKSYDTLWLNKSLCIYIENLSNTLNTSLTSNWFLRPELQLIIDLLESPTVQKTIDKPALLKLTFKIIACLSDYQLNDLLFLLNNIVFNIDMYLHKVIYTRSSVDHWNTVYVKICMQKYLIKNNTNNQHLIHNYDKKPILATDWPCVMLMDMYKANSAGRAFAMPEKDIIRTTFWFLSLLNANNIDILSHTEQLVYTMMAYLGKDSTFLEEEINSLLATFVKRTFSVRSVFNLDDTFGGQINFEHLYIAFLDQFQGTSYGDKSFSVLVMAPLAQKYNIKWRKMIWSEHAQALRFLTCTENDLIGSVEDYLQPTETDRTLLKCYHQAIHSNLLIPGSIAHKIATHHVDAYRSSLGKRKADNDS